MFGLIGVTGLVEEGEIIEREMIAAEINGIIFFSTVFYFYPQTVFPFIKRDSQHQNKLTVLLTEQNNN